MTPTLNVRPHAPPSVRVFVVLPRTGRALPPPTRPHPCSHLQSQVIWNSVCVHPSKASRIAGLGSVCPAQFKKVLPQKPYSHDPSP